MALSTFQLPVPETNWLPREFHAQVAQWLIKYKLSKLDNTRQLPLANGGKTDAYIDVRPGRSNSEANLMLASLYAMPLRWLGISRFLEVPDAISGVAALTSAITGIPYATIRKQPKEGRASDAQIIGEVLAGEEVVIIDDVITDGESKLPALRLCEERGIKVRAIVVLVDRQQGWREHFNKRGITVPVWAGMTLHDFRREAIASGVMLRCDSAIEGKNPIIVALDGKSYDETIAIADRLRPTGCILKVNDLLFAKGIDTLVPELSTYARVMADLKCHEIPNTVVNVCLRIFEFKQRPWAVTVHASGGGEMVSAAHKNLCRVPFSLHT